MQTDCKEETEWARNRALLLMPNDKFEEAMGAAEKAVKKEKQKANPLYVNLEDEDENNARKRKRQQEEE